MLKTTIDSSLIYEFFCSRPLPIPDGDEYENSRWLIFWEYLKSGSDVKILRSLEEKYPHFITALTSGRGNAKISFFENALNTHNGRLPKKTGVHETFFIEEKDKFKRKNYIDNNGHFFAFLDNFLERFEKLSLLLNEKNLHIRKNSTTNEFRSWENLGDWLLPFTDTIIIDSYLFADKSLISSNLERMLEVLNKATSVNKNVLIISYEGSKKEIIADDVYRTCQQIKSDKNLNINIGIILTNRIDKEHDRNIFFNYLRIKSGDSFNYFNSKGEVITKGTDLDFYPYSNPKNFNIAQSILSEVSKMINSQDLTFREENFRGNMKNGLLNPIP